MLSLVEDAVKEGLLAYEKEQAEQANAPAHEPEPVQDDTEVAQEEQEEPNAHTSSLATVARCKRPWWVCQPYVRPLPVEAIAKGSMSLSKKEKKKLAEQEEAAAAEAKSVGLTPGGRIEKQSISDDKGEEVEVPKEGVVCG